MEPHNHRKQGRKRKYTAAELMTAITGSAGIKKTIAERLHIHRHTVDYYLRTFPAVAAAYKNEIEGVGDLVEQVILKAIYANDLETARWYAKTKLKDRGYTERHEVREIKDLTDDELRRAIAIRIGLALDGAERSRPASPPDPDTLH